jgi:hypothetical protein
MLLLLKTFDDALARAPSPGDPNGKVVYSGCIWLARAGHLLVKMVKTGCRPNHTDVRI